MALTTGIVPDALGTSREPLQPRTSSPILSVPKRIRRKSSFIRRADSSEDYPSPHDSIYEAVYFSGTNSDSSGNRIELVDIPPRRSGTVIRSAHNDENRKLSDGRGHSIDDIEFRYGWGTPLETITEQKSFTTLRTARTSSRAGRPKSADGIPSIPFLGHRDSFSLAKSPRRKASFSLDDIVKVQQSYHEACSTIEREIFKLPINEVYAEPKEPIRAPPDRPPTPDGMPSWTAAQNAPRPATTRPEQNAFQRFFGLPATRTARIAFLTRMPQSSTQPRNRAVSAPVRGRMAPRFRPPRSAYGPIDQHPFANAPIAQVKSTIQAGPTQGSGSASTSAMARPRPKKGRRKLQRVRFTPSATARDSEILYLQAAIESTSTLAIHPLFPSPPMHASPISIEFSPTGCPHRRKRRKTLNPWAMSLGPQSSTPASGEFLQHLEATSSSPMPVVTVTPAPTITPPSPSKPPRTSVLAATSTTSLVTGDLERSRATSFSSTAYLMSGGLRSPSGSTVQRIATPQTIGPQLEEPFCWKCAVGKVGNKVDRWCKSWASCLCFVCCGVDTYDDESMQNDGRHPGYGPYLRGASSQDYLGPRRVTLDHSPAGIS
ncbi:hypothetical protein BDZ45DRAFT_458670 [Acephala macrosclerotiorum]|nr:hypothetical protein BDZ45DRAFT_458670 [Acephala macrosclerotiorum]